MKTGKFIAAVIGLLVFAGIGATPASAQYFGRNKVQYDSFDFKRTETERFEIFFYEEEREAVEDVTRMAERWYGRHSRTYLREFRKKKPLIFYANDADFQQTNVIGGMIGQGTGGVTESLKERVVMPLTGLYAETDHVLGHELVHSFQYDIALSRDDTTRFALSLLPLWLIEGTAEYLSVGRHDPHTAMWLRDAALRDDLPTMEMLSRDFRYFPYRYGQAYMAYIGGKYGDAAVANLYKLGGRVGLDSALVYTVGIKPDSLSKEWIESVKEIYLPLAEGRTPADSAGRAVLNKETTNGELSIAPSISPDGKWVAFLSERDLFKINLFIADAETGNVVKTLKGTNSNPHFDAIRFINSAGSWSPDGRKFAFITFVQGDNEISILDWNSGEIERRIAVQGVTAMSNPAWSPDGRQIAFSGMDGGISDLYILELATGNVRQLTSDRYGDLQPAWSPDGEKIAFVTDRGPEGTDFETLTYGAVRIGVIDVATSEIEIVRPFPGAKHTNPQFSPDGRSIYFISDHDGFKDIYRYAVEEGATYQVTRLQTGVSGITSLSPAMTVAQQSGRMMFSVFSDNKYDVFALEAEETSGTPVVTSASEEDGIAGILPPALTGSTGLVENYLNDSLTGLPSPGDFPAKDYGAKLRLDYVAPPTVGVSTGGMFGTQVAGGVGLFFSDMLGDHNLAVVAQANGTFKDIGAQVGYLNRKHRLNYGASVGHIPILLGFQQAGFDQTGQFVVEQIRQRIFIDNVDIQASYPFTTTKRFDLSAGFTRYGFDYEIDRFTSPNGFVFDRERIDLPKCSEDASVLCTPDAVYFFQTGAAYVGDFSNFGFTSPVQGGRYRFQASPFLGTESFIRLLADYRRYFFLKPITLAFRGMHLGNYGPKIDENSIFTEEYLGYANSLTFIRGYSFSSLEPTECTLNGDNKCAEVERLRGTRLALASAEVRIPLLGTEAFGLLNFPYLPTEIALFADAGLAWSEGDFPELKFERETAERVPVFSAGASTRFNLFGYTVLEIFYVYPFQRPEKGAHFGFQIVPGW
ncbi:MAG: PD40 domain-containing protein [Rhodothermia bacterium]|nr:PD40 domain-containing protein [Rhodothermia bacterium]